MEFTEAVRVIESAFGADLLGGLMRAREKAWSAELTVRQYEAFQTVHAGMSKLFAPKDG
jgi:hypothetical protein